MNRLDETDYEGKKPRDYIGRAVVKPFVGKVIDGYVDGVGIIILEIELLDGRIEEYVSAELVEFGEKR